MMMPMFTLLRYNKDNFMQNHPEHKEKGGEHVIRMDQLLSDLSSLAYESMGYDQRRVDLAVKIVKSRQDAIDAGFPILLQNKDFLNDRVDEAKTYLLTSGERSKFHKTIEKEEERDETADENAALEFACF
jgi:hypothetical protein